LAGLALALSACGGGDRIRAEQQEAKDAVNRAAQRTLEQGTAREHLAVRSQPHGRSDFGYDGVADLLAGQRRGTIVYRRYKDVAPRTKGTMITFDKVDYARLAGERTWTRFEPTPENVVDNIADIAGSLLYLGEATEGAAEDGKETVRGTPTTRYRARLDVQKAARVAPPEARPAYEQMLAVVRQSSIPFTVWIADSGGTIRRLRWTLDYTRLGSEAPQGEKRLVVVAELDGFGVDAAIEPPPPRITEAE
jgi:hypothetical protein